MTAQTGIHPSVQPVIPSQPAVKRKQSSHGTVG